MVEAEKKSFFLEKTELADNLKVSREAKGRKKGEEDKET